MIDKKEFIKYARSKKLLQHFKDRSTTDVDTIYNIFQDIAKEFVLNIDFDIVSNGWNDDYVQASFFVRDEKTNVMWSFVFEYNVWNFKAKNYADIYMYVVVELLAKAEQARSLFCNTRWWANSSIYHRIKRKIRGMLRKLEN